RSSNRAFPLSRAISSREFCTYVTLFSLCAGCCALSHSLRAARHRTFPQLNLHRARVRRNRGRLPSNGFIECAQSTMPASTTPRKGASDKALALIVHVISSFRFPDFHDKSLSRGKNSPDALRRSAGTNSLDPSPRVLA